MAEAAKSLKVFVSYSRADVAFADQLVLALEDKGFAAILDRHDISGAENWRERLGKLILSADAVAFVLTPKSAASDICAWEVAEAQRLGKRIIPITPANIDGVKPPEALTELNWIPFYGDPAIPGSGFYYGVMRLNEALSVDLDWLRAQTRYSERAIEWEKQRNEDMLLRGEALREAEAWLARTPQGSKPPDLVREYLGASGNVEQSRVAAAKIQLEEREQALKTAEIAVADNKRTQERLRRFSLWALVAGVVLLAIAIPGNYFAAVRTLDANDRRATLFADAANDLSNKGEYTRALLMALAGDPPARAGLFESMMRPDGNVAVRQALVRAYASDRAVASADGEKASSLATLPDGKRFITVQETGDLMLWTAGETLSPQALTLPKRVWKVFPLPDNDRVVVQWLEAAGNKPFAIWSLTQNKVLQDFGPESTAEGKEWPQEDTLSRDGKWLAMADQEGNLSVWSVETGALVKSTSLAGAGFDSVQAIAASEHDDAVVASSREKVIVWRPTADTRIGPTEGPFGEVQSLAYYTLPGGLGDFGGTFLFGSERGNVGSIEDGKQIPALQTFAENLTEAETVTRLRPSQDGRGVLMISDGGQVRQLDLASQKVNEPFGHRTDIIDAGYLPKVGMLVALSREGSVMLAAYGRSGDRVSIASAFGLPETTPQQDLATFTLRDGALVLVNRDKSLRLWQPGMPAALQFQVPETILQETQGTDFLFSAATSRLGVVKDDKVQLWTPDSVAPASITLGAPGVGIADGAFVADGKALFYQLASGIAGVRWIDRPEDLFPPRKVEEQRIYPSPDGRRMAQILDGNLVRVYEAGSDKPLDLKTRDAVSSVTFSNDGKVLALLEEKGVLELWRPGEARVFLRAVAHAGAGTSVAFEPGGDLFATTGDDLRIVLWRIGERDPVQVFEVPISAAGESTPVHFSADGTHISVGTAAGVLSFNISPIFRADVDAQVKMACERLEQRGVDGFSENDYNEFSFIGKFDDRRQRNPCVKLGYAPMKPKVPTVAKPTGGN